MNNIEYQDEELVLHRSQLEKKGSGYSGEARVICKITVDGVWYECNKVIKVRLTKQKT